MYASICSMQYNRCSRKITSDDSRPGDHQAEALGINLEDELSGKLTMNFSVLELNEDGLDGIFDSRIPICGTTENVLHVVKERMAEDGITLLNETQNPPHHVPADSPLVQTLLACYEEYTGRKENAWQSEEVLMYIT